MTGSILDDLFHGCALVAFVEQSRQEQGWPQPEATRQRAYDLYERLLASRHQGDDDVDETGPKPLPCSATL
jgi:hypothetical protein